MSTAHAITTEQLRLAWRQISRPGWPPTLEDAMALPVYRACLLGIARNLGRRGLDRMPPPPATQPQAPQLTLFAAPGADHVYRPARSRRR